MICTLPCIVVFSIHCWTIGCEKAESENINNEKAAAEEEHVETREGVTVRLIV